MNEHSGAPIAQGDALIRSLVVDDEEPARRRLIRLLERLPGIQVVGEAGNGLEAREQIRALAPDVVLLDIQMPELDGVSLVEAERGLPPVIFTTAHDRYAVRAFDLAAVDYLLKPITLARLARALGRLRALERGQLASLHRQLREDPPYVYVRNGADVRVFDARDVSGFFAANKYTLFMVGEEEQLLDTSLNELERRLDDHGFMRVHRSALINLAAVRALRHLDAATHVELVDGQCVPVSRRAAAALRRRLVPTT